MFCDPIKDADDGIDGALVGNPIDAGVVQGTERLAAGLRQLQIGKDIVQRFGASGRRRGPMMTIAASTIRMIVTISGISVSQGLFSDGVSV